MYENPMLMAETLQGQMQEDEVIFLFHDDLFLDLLWMDTNYIWSNKAHKMAEFLRMFY